MLTIGEVSSRAGFAPSALRYYEDVGLIPPTERVGGRRRYDESVLQRLAVIALCQEVGFSISEISDILGGYSPARWRKLAEQKLVEIEAHIAKAQATRLLLQEVLECGCGNPGSCELVHNALERRRS